MTSASHYAKQIVDHINDAFVPEEGIPWSHVRDLGAISNDIDVDMPIRVQAAAEFRRCFVRSAISHWFNAQCRIAAGNLTWDDVDGLREISRPKGLPHWLHKAAVRVYR